MTERDAFLAAIIESPSDDAPRLIYADWLEEHGETERAEFIRVQCELAKTPPCPLCRNGRYCQPFGDNRPENCICLGALLRHRERELLQRRKNDWLPPEVAEATIFGSASPEQVAAGLCWSRGFISEVALSCRDWLIHREELLRTVPLEKVTLTNWEYGFFGDNPGYFPAPPFASPVYILPEFTGVHPPLSLDVRNGKLFNDKLEEVLVVSLVEHELLLCQAVRFLHATYRSRAKALNVKVP